MKKSFWRETAWVYSPLLLCVVIMLPRLLSAQFGFFDDAVTLTTAQRIWTGQWSLGPDPNGRFRPGYWLFYAFLVRLFGKHPFWYFLTNLVLWLAITYGLIRLARGFGLGRGAAWLVGLTFVLSGPVIENVYTLSKPELPQSVLMLLLLLACGLYQHLDSRPRRSILFLVMVVLVFLACTTKETGILLAPAAVFSVFVTWAASHSAHQPDGRALRSRLVLLWTSLIGVILYSSLSYLILRKNPLAGQSGFFQYGWSWLISQARLLLGWLRRDYLYLLPVGLVALLVIFRKDNQAKLFQVMEPLGWFILWTGVYIPWHYYPEYYLLPAALAAAMLCGIVFALVRPLLAKGGSRRLPAWAALGLSGVLLLLTLPGQISNARLQLATDRANADMLDEIVDRAPRGSAVWMNIQTPNEYVAEFTLWVTQVENRPDLQVDYFHFQDLNAALAQGREVWIVSPFMENQFYPSVRVGMSELPTREWNASLDQYLAGRGEPVDEIRQSFQSSNFDPLRFFCPLTRSLSFCKVPNAPLDQRVFAYGWKILRVP